MEVPVSGGVVGGRTGVPRSSSTASPLGPSCETMPGVLWWSWGGGACFYERGTPVQREEGFFIDGQLVRSERFIICKATEGNTSVGKETHEMFSRCKANESQLMMQVQQKQVCFSRRSANNPFIFVYSVYTKGVIFFFFDAVVVGDVVVHSKKKRHITSVGVRCTAYCTPDTVVAGSQSLNRATPGPLNPTP